MEGRQQGLLAPQKGLDRTRGPPERNNLENNKSTTNENERKKNEKYEKGEETDPKRADEFKENKEQQGVLKITQDAARAHGKTGHLLGAQEKLSSTARHSFTIHSESKSEEKLPIVTKNITFTRGEIDHQRVIRKELVSKRQHSPRVELQQEAETDDSEDQQEIEKVLKLKKRDQTRGTTQD